MQLVNIFLYLGIILLSIVGSYYLNLIALNLVCVLQQNHYYLLNSLKNFYLIKNKTQQKIIALTFTNLVCCLVFYLIIILNNINSLWFILNIILFNFVIILFYYFQLKKIKLKVKLVITNRIKRLILTMFIVNFLLLFFSQWFLFFCGATYLIFVFSIIAFCEGIVIAISNLINYPIEQIIKLKYIFLAKQKLKKYKNLIVIGITGSFGKTSTKNFLYEILKQKYNVLITPNSFNTPMGITKTILEKLNSSYDIFIVEMGADHNNDIKKLCKIISPNIAIITSVGKQHLKTFKTFDNIINTKYQIVQYAKPDAMFFTNTDDKICNVYFNATIGNKYSIGSNANCFVKISDIKVENSTTFNLTINNVSHQFSTNILGKHNIYNIALCVAVAIKLNVSINLIINAVKNLTSVNHRLELKVLNNGATLIDDSFNSNPVGASEALKVLSLFNKEKFVLTCGMVELGAEQYSENYKFALNLAKTAFKVYIINETNKQALLNGLINGGFNKNNIKCFKTFNEAFSNVLKVTNFNSVILIENDLPDNYK